MAGEMPTEEVGRKLAQFQHLAAYWESALNEAPGGDTEAQQEAAIDDLNEWWPFRGEEFYFNGIGVFPVQIEQEDGRVTVEDAYGEIANGFGVSLGVSVVRMSEEHPLKIMHRFLVQQTIQPHCMTVVSQQQISIFMDPKNMTLFSPDEVEAAYDTTGVPLAEDQWGSFLQRRADSLRRTMGTVTFQKLSARAKEARLSAFVVKTESRLDQFRESEATICGERAYVRNPLRPRPVDISGDAITGICLGLDALPGEDQEEADRGLCLVISPDEETREALKLGSYEAMHIPIAGQQLEVEFS